jgi:N-dimethylarginine dimethylaminohydrolase
MAVCARVVTLLFLNMNQNHVSTWFISAPANRTKQEAVEKLQAVLKSDLAQVFPFGIPEFKVCLVG